MNLMLMRLEPSSDSDTIRTIHQVAFCVCVLDS